MDPSNNPFNALIVRPTNSGRTQFLVNQLCGPFRGKFDYIVLVCPTFGYNKTLYRFAERDPRLFVIICEQHEVEAWLKITSMFLEGTNTLIVLDDCAASKDVKGRTGELVNFCPPCRHQHVGADRTALQHCEALSRECCSYLSVLHAFSQDTESHL